MEFNKNNFIALESKDNKSKYSENVMNYKNYLNDQLNNHQITQQIFPLDINNNLLGKNVIVPTHFDNDRRIKSYIDEDSDIRVQSHQYLPRVNQGQGKNFQGENSEINYFANSQMNFQNRNCYNNMNNNQILNNNTATYYNKNSQFQYRQQHTEFPFKNYETTYNYNITNNVTLNFPFLDDEKLAKGALLLAKDQTGCRLLQKKIESNPRWGTDEVFPIVFPHLFDLILDSFGNYLIQKLIDYLDTEHLAKIINFINLNFYYIGINIHGTRVIQKFIEKIENPELFELFKIGFQPNIFDLMKDVNGNHIVIKFVHSTKDKDKQFLYDIIEENLIDLATNKHSCCAFQKCVETATDEQREKLIEKIVDNTFILISDQYGNYVLQFIITLDNHEVNEKISFFFHKKIAYLSRQKFSSNVIEKLFNYSNERTKFNMIKEICNPKIIFDLLVDMYGNYVLQKALIFAKEPYKTIFLNSITPHLEKLQILPFGQKLYGKLLSIYPELNFVKMDDSAISKNTKHNFHQITHINQKQNTQNLNSGYEFQTLDNINSQNVNIFSLHSGNVYYSNTVHQDGYLNYKNYSGHNNNFQYINRNNPYNNVTQNNLNRNIFNNNKFGPNKLGSNIVNRNFNMFQS